jgi:hypothetical protein
MSFTFEPAIRTQTPMIIGIAGPSGSGKTYTALTLAMGLAGPYGKVAVGDTEGRRALHYADLRGDDGEPVFRFDHCDIEAPYTPARFLEVMQTAAAAGYAVVVLDSFSDEYVGEGGLVDMADAELKKMRVPNTAAAWAKPKAQHKLVTRWMRQSRCHLIFCLRAEEKVRLEKVVRDGREQTVVVPIGWQPICEKNVPYEMATSFMLTPDAPGVPKPIKIQQQHRHLFPTDRPITRASGQALAEWCAGGMPVKSAPEPRERPSRAIRYHDEGRAESAPASLAEAPDSVLLSTAYDAAAQGTAALRVFWEETLEGTGKRRYLKTVMEKYLKPLAEQADQAAAEGIPASESTAEAAEEAPGDGVPKLQTERSSSADPVPSPGDEEPALEAVE